jgi:KipI family sensor histidine kinase inhibitor
VTAPDQRTIRPFGEAAFIVQLGGRIDRSLNARAVALVAAVQADRREAAPWLRPPVAGYASVLVPFDPALVEHSRVERWLRDQLERPVVVESSQQQPPPIEIPVRYGGVDGPDLDEVAHRTGLAPARVIELHASVEYRVYMLGFAPGFAYLGELPAELELPRRETPRPRVPAGSVAIAARQTAVYPLITPGGWHLIGRTEVQLWQPRRQPPTLLSAGDAVRFVAA